MLSLGQRYQESSKEAYLQLLQEGHFILKGALLLSIDAKQGELVGHWRRYSVRCCLWENAIKSPVKKLIYSCFRKGTLS